MKNYEIATMPKLRFLEFRDGESWTTKQLSNLYRFKRSNTLSRDKLNYEIGTIKNIHYGDIHTRFSSLFHIDREYVPFINQEVSVVFDEDDDCEEGDIILADASEDLYDVGKAIEVVSLDRQRVVAGTHTILASRRGNVPIVGFGGYLFQSHMVRAAIRRESQGSKVYGISANNISSIALPIPPTKPEQQKIAECLSSLDDLISAENRKLETLNAYKKGQMQYLFPQHGQTQPRLRFPEFRNMGGWKQKRLVEVLSPIERKLEKPNEIYTGLGLRSHGKGTFLKNLSDPNKNSMEFLYEVKHNDLVVNITFAWEGAIAIAGIGDDGALVSHRFPTYTFDKGNAIPEFIKYIIHNKQFIHNLGVISPGSGGRNRVLDKSAFLMLSVLLPDLEEQEKIAESLITVDHQIKAQTNKIEILKQHKRGLMQQLFPSLEVVVYEQ